MKSLKINMDVSVIIVNYNTRALAVQCIESVIRHTRDLTYEVIFVDNASVDNSVETIAEKFPSVRIISNIENVGFGKANNQGFNIAEGKYIFLLNSDAYLISNAIKAFFHYMENDQSGKVAVCGAELISGNERRIASYGNFPTVKELFFSLGPYLLFRKYFERELATCVINYDERIKEVDYISGADMFIRRTAIEKTGFFDEAFFLYYEETELSYRLKRHGFSSVILPAVNIVHLEGASHGSVQAFNYKKFEIMTRSRNLFFRKCYGKLNCLVSQVLYIVSELLLTVTGRGRGNFIKKAKIILFA